MFSRRSLAIGSRGCWRVFPAVCLIAALTSVAWADARFSLEGQLNLGTDYQDISFNLSDSVEIIYSPLAFRTWSYSGGINSAGEVIPAGGFDPTLALLNSAGTEIAYKNDGTGIDDNYDSLLSFYVGAPEIPSPLAAGNYILRLEPLGDSFGAKTKNWAVDLNGPDNVLSFSLTIIDLLPGYAGISKVAVTGPGSKWTNSAGLIVGAFGQGTLQVANGAMASNTSDSYIGFAPSGNGAVTVRGTGSLWNNSGDMNIGYAGTGQLTVSGGGRVNNTIGNLGTDVGSMGTATVTGAGSTWANSGGLFVGYSGTGTLRVADGAVVSNSFAFINLFGGSTSVATVTGPGSKWTNSEELYVGNSGTGTLLVEAGGMVSNTNGSIAFNSGSTGAATVTGQGSKWTNSSNLYVGGGALDPGGNGELSVKDSGLVEVAGALKIWNSGMVTLDGGSLFVGSIDAESLARIHFNAGSFIVTSGNLSVGIPCQSSETIFPKDLNVNVFNLATVPADGTLVVLGGFSSGGLTNLGTTLFVNTAIRGPVNNPTGSATNVVGNVVFTGLVSGGGGIFGSGTADFRGGVSPGASPARLNIGGSANFATSNTLFIELGGLAAGIEFDVLEIGGQADLGGTLDVSLLGGFTPSAGDRFDVLTAALVQGTFDTKLLPTLAGGLQWLVDYRTDGVSLLVSSASLAGDYNGNGTVDAADYTVWRNHLGAPAGTLPNDTAGGVIGTAQYAQWKANFGQTVGAGSGASSRAVPEPATVVMLVLGMLALRLPRRAAVLRSRSAGETAINRLVLNLPG